MYIIIAMYNQYIEYTKEVIQIAEIREEFVRAILDGSEQLDVVTHDATKEMTARHEKEQWEGIDRRQRESHELYEEIRSAKYLCDCLSMPVDTVERRVATEIMHELLERYKIYG